MRVGRALVGGLVALALAVSACGESTDGPPGAGSSPTSGASEASSTEAPLIPEETELPTELPPDVLAGEMQDLAKLAERLAQELPAQRRPAPVAIAPGSEQWQVGAAYRGYFADPDIVRHAGRWYDYATNTSHLRLPTLVSRDLRTWTPLTDRSGGKVDPLQPAGWQGQDEEDEAGRDYPRLDVLQIK